MKNPFKAKQNSNEQERPKKIVTKKSTNVNVIEEKQEKVITSNNSDDATVKDIDKGLEKSDKDKPTKRGSYPIYDEQQFNTINSIFAPKTVFKRLVEKQLTIILLENTTEVAKVNDLLKKIIQSSVTSGLVCIISYGESVYKSEIVDYTELASIKYNENLSQETCLFDALVELETTVSNNYMRIKENEKDRTRITNIEIIGIGTCKDDCSKVKKEEGIACFCKVLSKPKVTTKYFCLTDESFIEAAEIGFHSIGAIFRNYQ